MDVEILIDDSYAVTEVAVIDEGAGDDAAALESLLVAAVLGSETRGQSKRVAAFED